MSLETTGPQQRYARALYALSQEQGVDISASMSLLQEVFSISTDLEDVLSNPMVSSKNKEEVVQKLWGAKAPQLVKDFIALVASKNRLDCLSGMVDWFQHYEREARGEIIAKVASATKLSAAQRKSVIKFVKKYAQNAKDVQLEERIDPLLLAGLKIQVGSNEYDATVQGQIQALRATLKV